MLANQVTQPQSATPRMGIGAQMAGAVFVWLTLLGACLVAAADMVLGESLEEAGAGAQVVEAAAQHLHRSMGIVAGVLILAGTLGQYLVLRKTVLRPLAALSDYTNPTHGAAPKAARTGPSQDEIGRITSSLSAMLEPLRAFPTSVRELTGRLAESVGTLSASTRDQSQTLTRQAGALHETQITAEEMRQTSELAAQKARLVLDYAERADSLSRTGEGAMVQSLSALRDIRGQVEEIAERITTLGERAIRIGQVTQTVKDLADQSNMLALNAAIEAVRSGEHGKGFGVVAREIRSLADQSIQATVQVREMLEDISEAIRGAVAITEKGSQRIDAGLEQVKTSGEKLSELSTVVRDNSQAVRQINTAVGQQNQAVSLILTALTEQGTLMQETLSRLGATDASVQTISTVSQSLTQMVSDFGR